MKIFLAIFLFVVALSGCAHKDLKAPCANVASLASGSIPCDQREPLNAKIVPSTFAQ